MSDNVAFIPIPQEQLDRQAAEIEAKRVHKRQLKIERIRRILVKIDPILANKPLTKDLARKIMHDKRISLGCKIDLYTEITWRQRICWFPIVTLLYVVIAFTAIYPIMCVIL